MEFDGPAYERFRDAIFGAGVAEGDLFDGDPALVPELDWQSRWYAGEFGREFSGTEGEKISIRQFGWWNRSAGPDFIETAVTIDGETRAGAIELDIDARDWERHGHATNPLYEEVVLHLFFRQPAGKFFTRTASHRRVVQVVLPATGAEPGRREAAARLGRCSVPMAAMPVENVEAFLRGAARHRATEKARRFLRVAGLHGLDEAWYLALAEMLGYHANREAMRVLAQRIPLRLLRSHGDEGEALLFGHAGFLAARPYDDENAPAARLYLRGLWESWWKYRTDLVRPPRWDYAAQRPANHPQRRVAVLAMIARQWPKWRPALDAADVPGLRALFDALDHPFWSDHFTLPSDARPEAVALVGGERVNDFLGNTVLPVRALADPAAWADYDRLPGRQASRSVQRAAERILGRRPDVSRLLRSFACQQGLLQVYRDFCLNDASACEDCVFPEQLARWRSGGSS